MCKSLLRDGLRTLLVMQPKALVADKWVEAVREEDMLHVGRCYLGACIGLDHRRASVNQAAGFGTLVPYRLVIPTITHSTS